MCTLWHPHHYIDPLHRANEDEGAVGMWIAGSHSRCMILTCRSTSFGGPPNDERSSGILCIKTQNAEEASFLIE